MKTKLFAAMLFALVGAVAVAADRSYSCSLKVANPVRDSSVSKPNPAGNGRASGAKTTRQKFTWPISVSFTGKDFPQEGVVVKCFCIGTEEGEGAMLATKDFPVKLDEKGKFACEFVSPEATLTKTKGKKGKDGGSKESGQRITGCIVQLVIGDAVERSFASKSVWKKLAKTNPLPQEDVLKLR